MRPIFAISVETARIAQALRQMTHGGQMTFKQLSADVGFQVTSSTSAFQTAKRMVERDDGIFIGTIRGTGFFRGIGDDMADSLEPMAKRMRRIAKRSISRADLALRNNLSEERHDSVSERRARASIIYSTTAAPMPASNRKKPEPAQEAPPRDAMANVRSIR